MAPDKVVSLADFENADDVEYATIPAWKEGEVIRIKSVSAGDMIEWSEANDGPAKRTAGLRLIVKSVVDADGRLLLNDSHLQMLRNRSHKKTEEIVKAILKLN